MKPSSISITVLYAADGCATIASGRLEATNAIFAAIVRQKLKKGIEKQVLSEVEKGRRKHVLIEGNVLKVIN